MQALCVVRTLTATTSVFWMIRSHKVTAPRSVAPRVTAAPTAPALTSATATPLASRAARSAAPTAVTATPARMMAAAAASAHPSQQLLVRLVMTTPIVAALSVSVLAMVTAPVVVKTTLVVLMATSVVSSVNSVRTSVSVRPSVPRMLIAVTACSVWTPMEMAPPSVSLLSPLVLVQPVTLAPTHLIARVASTAFV